jgi:hypothetical protein
VCGRSSTTCSTCRHFRRSVALGIGYCGLDANRAPLDGDEVRPCWQPIVLSSGPAIGEGEAVANAGLVTPELVARPDTDALGGISPARR